MQSFTGVDFTSGRKVIKEHLWLSSSGKTGNNTIVYRNVFHSSQEFVSTSGSYPSDNLIWEHSDNMNCYRPTGVQLLTKHRCIK